jgi:hypothetical protein
MTTDDADLEPHSLLRVRVTTDGDPSVLSRLLGYFTNLNITPRRVNAEFGSEERLHLFVDVCGLPEDRVSLITAKIAQNPCVLNAFWHRLV